MVSCFFNLYKYLPFQEQYDFCSFYFSCFWSHTFFTQLFVVLLLLSHADKECILAERKPRPTKERFQISFLGLGTTTTSRLRSNSPAQRKVHESKSCVDNGYRLCSRAVAIAPLLLNYQMQIKLECTNGDTKTRWTSQNGSFFLITHESSHQWSQRELVCSLCMQWKVWGLVEHHVGPDKIRVFFFFSGLLWASVQFISITSELLRRPAYISNNNSLHSADGAVTAVCHVKMWRFIEFV